jgi:hypothetical protein
MKISSHMPANDLNDTDAQRKSPVKTGLYR